MHDLATVEILHPRDNLIKDVSGLRFREEMFDILDTLPVHIFMLITVTVVA